jgi:hypothetical protein
MIMFTKIKFNTSYQSVFTENNHFILAFFSNIINNNSNTKNVIDISIRLKIDNNEGKK